MKPAQIPFKVDNRSEEQKRTDWSKEGNFTRSYVPGDPDGCGCDACKRARRDPAWRCH